MRKVSESVHFFHYVLMLSVYVFVQRMFEKATKKLVQQIDPKGALIPASSLNDSKKLQPLAVVQKIQKSWFWQQTKYKPTEFKINDLLEGDPIKPGKVHNEYVS